MSVAKMSYCGMGERCKLYDPETEKSQKLGRYHKSTICDRCWAAGYRPEDALSIAGNQVGAGDSSPDESEVCSQCGNEAVVARFTTETDDRPLCEECQERLLEQWQKYGFLTYIPAQEEELPAPPEDTFNGLFRTARVLFESGISDEDQIVPTLVFANRADTVPQLAAIGERFTKVGDNHQLWEKHADAFCQRFRGLTPVTTLDDILVLRRVSAFVDLVQYPDTTVVKEVVIDVFMRSAKPEEVAKRYRQRLAQEHVPYDKSNRGSFTWEFADAYLSMTVDPGKELNSGQAARFSSVGRQMSFPPPQLVGELYSTLKGSVNARKFRGIAYALGGRQSGTTALPDNLIPACVAWYMRERGDIADKRQLTRLLNRHLLVPCGKPEVDVTSDHAIWRNIDRVADSIKRVELTLQKNGWEPLRTRVSETRT